MSERDAGGLGHGGGERYHRPSREGIGLRDEHGRAAMSMVLVSCAFCGGEGRVNAELGHRPDPEGATPCPACGGSGSVLVHPVHGSKVGSCGFCGGVGRVDPAQRNKPSPDAEAPCPGCGGCGYRGRDDDALTKTL